MKKEASTDLWVYDLLKEAAKTTEVDIPETMVKEEAHRMVHQYEDQLRMQGLSLEQYLEFTKTTMDELKKKMSPEGLKRIKYRYLLESIATKEKIEVSDEEAKEEAKKLAENYGLEEADFLSKFGGIEMVKYDLQMRKAIEILKNN